jgi:hypothetical protein
MMPFAAALSSLRAASRVSSVATVASREPMAVRAFRTTVLQADVHDELRTRNRRDRTISFLDDLMLAKESHLHENGQDYSTGD